MPTTSNERAIHASTVIVCEGEDEYDILECLRSKRGWTDRDVELQNAKGRDKHPASDRRYPGASRINPSSVMHDKLWLALWLLERTDKHNYRLGHAFNKFEGLHSELPALVARFNGILDRAMRSEE